MNAQDADRAQSLNELSERVIGAVYEVANALGAGFLEKVYERALILELRLRGMEAVAQAAFSVSYKGILVGQYLCDVLVENAILVELKCVERFNRDHLAQCLNYLKASDRSLCLLINFQRANVEVRRVVRNLGVWEGEAGGMVAADERKERR